jgi:hypothetical protein
MKYSVIFSQHGSAHEILSTDCMTSAVDMVHDQWEVYHCHPAYVQGGAMRARWAVVDNGAEVYFREADYGRGNIDPESITAFRRAKGWTRRQLADAVGVSWRTVEGWEQGRPVGRSASMLIRSL